MGVAMSIAVLRMTAAQRRYLTGQSAAVTRTASAACRLGKVMIPSGSALAKNVLVLKEVLAIFG
jgi:hypothetical protein